MIQFFKDVWYEMTQKVTWPTARRLVTATTIIVSFVLIWSVIIYAFDAVFITAQQYVISDIYDDVALQDAKEGKITIDQVMKFNTYNERQQFYQQQEAAGKPGYGKNPRADEKQPDGSGTTIPLTPEGTSPGGQPPQTIPLPGNPGGQPPSPPPTGNP
jgi:preprotein translocase SecE subunit